MCERVQLKCNRGWKMPALTVKVDRTTKFGNPFSIDRYGREQAVEKHREWITGMMSDEQIRASYPQMIATHLISRRQALQTLLPSLAGKNLACWCTLDGPCHADTLLELANIGVADAGLRKAG